MKRKVIQIAESTQLVSLPRKWAMAHGIKKGNELDVKIDGHSVIVSTETITQKEKKDLDVSDLGPMVLRTIVALYKKGIDEIKVMFDKPESIVAVQKVIGKEAVGYEITDQGEHHCIIKHVSGELEDFDSVLRRTFLLLISMAERSYDAVESGAFEQLSSVAFLEEANNRFTTSCRRALNKVGYKDPKVIGPLYYIVEDLENLADQYKYLCQHLYKLKDKKLIINKKLLSIFKRINEMVKSFYELFYKYDNKRAADIGRERKRLVEDMNKLIESTKDPREFLVLNYLMTIMQKTFCMIGPLMVIAI